ncbi:alpha/beta fold hydrolase [Taibaiella soli]|uniref:Alpha/beta hydrolase n=1 Tax=Taibaiella soli TaxID=1649169 RepID=A0A2W2AT14_9BACT|nr:alpha/beta fold hydrolase [Taibaiella soli]PZF71104.1 alpha/beta hydrolase [Taibaiella soli]
MHILLLHGAIGAADQLKPLADKLSKDFTVHILNFSGHGGEPFSEQPFSIPLFAEEVLAYLDQNGIEQVNIFGFSMGGFVGMYLAKHYPKHVLKLMTLATKFDWNKEIAEKEKQMINPEKITAKVPAFAESLEKRHTPNNWKEVLARMADMITALGEKNAMTTEDYAAIEIPVLMLLGDRDKMVTLDETLRVYKTLPNAQMGMLPATGHPIEQADLDLVGFYINRFFNHEGA